MTGVQTCALPILGTFISQQKKKYEINGAKAYSNKLTEKVKNKQNVYCEREFENLMFLRRGFNGANTGLLVAQFFTETFSPFYDLDLLNFCLQIPNKKRIGHNLYIKWILKKYPDSASYIWESTKMKPGARIMKIHYKGKSIPIKNITPWLMQKIGAKQPSNETRHGMNPLDYWYKTNNDIKQFQDNYFDENISKIGIQKLKEDCEMLYKTGNAIEKNQVLTLLSAIKLYW